MKQNITLFALSVAVGVTLVGCSSSVTPPTSGEPEQPVETPVAQPLNDNGHFAAGIGEEIVVKFPGTENEAIRFAVTGVEHDPACTGDPMWLMPPDQGQFVVLTLEITTSPDYLELMAAQEALRVSWNDWVAYLPDGSKIENSPNGLFCFPEEESLPLEIPAGATITGKYTLDLPPGTSSAAWAPTYIYGVENGWEWQLLG